MCTTKMLFAQAPGFLGKKLNIGSYMFYSPTIYLFESKNNLSSLSASRFKPNAQFELNYSITRRLELTAGYRFEKDDVEYTRNNLYVSAGENEAEFNFTEEFESQKLIYQYYSIGLKFFRNSFISPIGKFLELDIGLVTFQHPDQVSDGGKIHGSYFTAPDSLFIYGHYEHYSYPINVQKKGNYLRLSFALGKNIPLSDRLLFGYKYQFNYHFKGGKVYNYGPVSENDIQTKILGSIAYKYKRLTDLFSFKVGFKYLFF